MEEINDTRSLESKHSKERKELQAHIQALKKIAKNDKSKKKELSAEIARLESDMEARHSEEIEVFKEETEATEFVKNPEHDMIKIKVSKAQKRRDKKTKQDKDREEQIKFQEKENLHGPRIQEIQAISEKLKQRNLKIFSIPSDGDCLYKAVAHQLHVLRQKSISVDELRNNVASYMRQNKPDFIPFMSNPNTCEVLTDDEFEEYCDKIGETKLWGGQLEIRALSNSLKCPINIIQATGPECIEQGTEHEGPPLIITYHRHMYKLGEHYNSTCNNLENSD